MLQQDSEISVIAYSFLSTDHGNFVLENSAFTTLQVQPPVSSERLARYQELRLKIGLAGPIFRGERGIEFIYDMAGLDNGESTKGFLYSTRSLEPKFIDLDHFRKPTGMGQNPFFMYKPLARISHRKPRGGQRIEDK
jgi:hypothetical protein